MKLSALKTDSAKLEQGQWVRDIPDMDGLELKVRGLGNTEYRRLMDKKVEAVPRQKKVRGLEPDTRDRIVSECLHEAVLEDWRGLTGDEGEAVPYSAGLALQLLTEPDFARFRSAVLWAASVVADEADLSVTDAEGN
ncbi:hypothetical protein [Methylobacterium sp. Leaf106]|uniref:hypothetical protein n=1 Tax=Methylobacterium sp. Leaf106 TaxID=1736255 RepID=UPI0006F447A7|nr:hypothetical protein [Methylobacterium sp. Leaf106]KQP53000.1 hypothetical protein ASF34_01105 [Methylobacterium sp. Leaf106]